MLWTAKTAAQFLRMEIHQVYYLLAMGYIEAVKVGKVWRLVPEAVIDYDKRHAERKNRKPAGYFVYTGSGGFLFSTLPDHLPPNTSGANTRMERRRRALVHRPKRSQAVLFKKLKPVNQPELFAL